MKKINLLLMLVLCVGLVSASTGEEFYAQGSDHLANGDLWNARGAFESATQYLTGDELEEVEEILSFLNRIDSSSSRTAFIDHENWYFIGEIKEEDTIAHVYYDIYGDNIMHTMISGEIDIDSYSEDLGISFSSEYIGSESILAYESPGYSVLTNTQSQIKFWYCENTDTTNVAYITFGGNYEESEVFNSEISVCPSSFSVPVWVYFVLGILVLGGLGYYFGYLKRKR